MIWKKQTKSSQLENQLWCATTTTNFPLECKWDFWLPLERAWNAYLRDFMMGNYSQLFTLRRENISPNDFLSPMSSSTQEAFLRNKVIFLTYKQNQCKYFQQPNDKPEGPLCMSRQMEIGIPSCLSSIRNQKHDKNHHDVPHLKEEGRKEMVKFLLTFFQIYFMLFFAGSQMNF